MRISYMHGMWKDCDGTKYVNVDLYFLRINYEEAT